MPATDSVTSPVRDESLAHTSSGNASTGVLTVATEAQLQAFTDIIARIVIPRKLHFSNDAFHFEILVKSQKIAGFRVAGVGEFSKFKVEPEFVYIEDPKSQSVRTALRAVINAAACTLDDGKFHIERLLPNEKSRMSEHSVGIHPNDAVSEDTVAIEVAPVQPSSVAIEKPVEALQAKIINNVAAPEEVKPDATEVSNVTSSDNNLIREFFEQIKDKSNFACLQDHIGDNPSCYGGQKLDGGAPEEMFAKLYEWNELVSGSLSATPKILTSFGPSTRDPVMIMAVSNSQRLLIELNANKFGVALALWNSLIKRV